MTRQAVTKHLKPLRKASHLVPSRRGGEKRHDLNPVPILEMDREDSRLIEGVSGVWPMILSSLKSLLETGESLEATRRWPEGI